MTDVAVPLQETEQDKNLKLFLESLLDKSSQVAPPDVLLEVIEYVGQTRYNLRVMTSQNISVVQGKAKAGKTFFLSVILPAIISAKTHLGKFVGVASTITKAGNVVMVDTEQARYDGYQVMRRIVDNCEYSDNFAYSTLRQYAPDERISIIEAYLESSKGTVCLLVIDGIADLTTTYNDEEKASLLIAKLMKWNVIYNVHICVIIHENKAKDNNQATGWLGRMLYQKAETVISVSNTNQSDIKKVKSEMQRGTKSFEDFCFQIHEGKAYIVDGVEEVTQNSF